MTPSFDAFPVIALSAIESWGEIHVEGLIAIAPSVDEEEEHLFLRIYTYLFPAQELVVVQQIYQELALAPSSPPPWAPLCMSISDN